MLSGCKKILFLLLFYCGVSTVATAQPDTGRHALLSAFKKAAIAKKTTAYNYKSPSGELMSWPNYPLTAAQVAARDEAAAQNNKVVPFLINQAATTWLNGKKQHKPAQVPQF